MLRLNTAWTDIHAVLGGEAQLKGPKRDSGQTGTFGKGEKKEKEDQNQISKVILNGSYV